MADGRTGVAAGAGPAAVAQPLAVRTAARWIQPVSPEIVPATDLGSVLTLKHGTLFLLTDQFGDVRSDSRGLGLYRGDTRVLSCATVRVNGARLSLLQSPAGGTYAGAIEMTNPGPLRNVHDKIQPEVDIELARRTLGIRRERVIAGALRERLRVVNHAEHEAAVEVELELGDDGADIFEVRGYPRPARGCLRPIAIDAEGTRLAFRYDGLDRMRRTTFVAFTSPAIVDAAPPPEPGFAAGGQVRARWAFTLQPGTEEAIEWRIWDAVRPMPDGLDPVADDPDPAAGDVPADLFPEPPAVRSDEAAAAYHAWTRGTTTVESDHELFNLTVRRSIADLRLLVNDGPDAGERYVAAGVPWFATLFGRDAILIAL
ncbi:MAG TPA: glycogen debranching N-terminal domain-containing protein, partial [Candidatus Limnocylindrales bacterium]